MQRGVQTRHANTNSGFKHGMWWGVDDEGVDGTRRAACCKLLTLCNEYKALVTLFCFLFI